MKPRHPNMKKALTNCGANMRLLRKKSIWTLIIICGINFSTVYADTKNLLESDTGNSETTCELKLNSCEGVLSACEDALGELDLQFTNARRAITTCEELSAEQERRHLVEKEVIELQAADVNHSHVPHVVGTSAFWLVLLFLL